MGKVTLKEKSTVHSAFTPLFTGHHDCTLGWEGCSLACGKVTSDLQPLAVSVIFPVLLCTREALMTRHSRLGGKEGQFSLHQESQPVYFSFSSSRNGTQGLAYTSKCSAAEPYTQTLFFFLDRVYAVYTSLKLRILLLLSAEC